MKIDNKKVLEELLDKGYSTVHSFMNDDTIKEILNETTKDKYKINKNASLGLFYETQYYFMNLLAESQKCYEFITSDFVIDLCEKYLNNRYRLKALRYYETMSGHKMKWHVDNKKHDLVINLGGIIFIIYLCDVYDGELQYIEGSHKFNEKYESPDLTNELIDSKYKHLIKSFKMPKGSMIIYDARGIHRAKPFNNKKYVRKSLYFQVDGSEKNATKILLNTKFLNNLNPKIEKILGFGKENNRALYPKTNLNRYPINFNVFTSILKWFTYRFLRFILRTEPRYIKKIFKK
jgi:hypothetical protein